MADSKIEWTDSTWNPVRGCVKVSPGCEHCYAETFAERFRGVPEHPYEQGFDLRIVPGKLLEPLSWSKPKTVFVNSMSDLFQEAIPDDYVAAVADVMEATPWHTYQVLTKRGGRLARLLGGRLQSAAKSGHIWWGVSVENRKNGLPRIEQLRRGKPRVPFLSVEPLLDDLGRIDLSGVAWVIVGGESGHGARPMNPSWVRSIRAQCAEAGVAFFFKQWGGVQKKRTGRVLDGVTYDEMPHRETVKVPLKADRARLRDELAERFVEQIPFWENLSRPSPARRRKVRT